MIEIILKEIEYKMLHSFLGLFKETKEAKVTAAKVIESIGKAVRDGLKGEELPKEITLGLEKYELGNLFTGFTKVLDSFDIGSGDISNLKGLSKCLKFGNAFENHLNELTKTESTIELDCVEGFEMDDTNKA